VELVRSKVLVLVLAGGEGGRLGVLTEDRAKPAMPYAGVYRLIDFPLSNCHHSGLTDVWILQQYEPHSLSEHLSNGRPWDLDRTHGGLRVLHPYQGDEDSGWYKGNADAIQRNRNPIEEFEPELILVLSADHVYKLDYGAVITRHREHGAELTMVTTQVPREQASRFGNVRTDDGERVVDFAYKPEEPTSDVVTTEVFLYETSVLLDILAELAEEAGEDEGLQDFGDELVPRLVEQGGVFAYPLEGYWKDVGTIESYWKAHMDLLRPRPPIDLDDPSWPILTLSPQRPPAEIAATARVHGALVSSACSVRGEVVRSVLGPGVVIGEGAVVRDSVLMRDALVEGDASVDCAILDAEVTVRKGARVGAARAIAESASEQEIAVAAKCVEIPAGAEIRPGARLEASGRKGGWKGHGREQLEDAKDEARERI
jgi:glucose-1-phosphate adenylyltransferase